MITGKLWIGLGAGVATVALGATLTAVLGSAPPALPLRPLSVDRPAPDNDEHVLVRVPAGTAVVPVRATADAPAAQPTARPVAQPAVEPVPPGTPLPDLDLVALRRYEGRVRTLARSGDRVVAVLTDGTVADVTVGGKGGPVAAPAATGLGAASEPAPDTNPPGAGHPAVTAGRVPAPLAGLAADPRTVEVSRVDGNTWRVVGDLTAAEVTARTGLAADDDVLLHVEQTNDPYAPLLWALENRGGTVGGFPALADADVDGVEAAARIDGTGVVVAVVDSGIQPDHPDLPPLWRNTAEICGNNVDDDHNGYVDDCAGWDFVHGDNTPFDAGDSNDHGTHIAGTIAAIADNGRGVAGLAPGATIMSLKVTANGSLYLSHAAQAIRYAADHGARVVNASFGTNPGAPRSAVRVLEEAVEYARVRGVLVVAAAGNDAVDTDALPTWPAGLPQQNVLSVGASTAEDRRAGFSNYGATSVDLFAPGHYIASTVSGGRYGAMQGTSMAAPHVTAAAALLLAQDPTLPVDALRQRLLDTTDPVAAFAGRSVTGGRLNADRALAAAAPTDPAVTATGLLDFRAERENAVDLTVTASPALVPPGVAVTWQGTLMTTVGGVPYGVVGHPVTLDGQPASTDDNAQVLLGPAGGIDGADPVLTGSGLAVRLGTALPAGEYALVVELVSAADRRFGYGQSVALFFAVAEPGTAPDATASPGATVSPSASASASAAPAPGATGPGAPGSQPTSAPGGTGPTLAPAPTGGPGLPVIASPGIPGSGGAGGTPGAPAPGGQNPSGGTPGTGPTAGPAPSSGAAPPPGATAGPTSRPTAGVTAGPTGAPGSGPSGVPGAGASTAPTTAPTTVPTTVPTVAPMPPAPVTRDGITITSVTPNRGPAAGGTAVMIQGANLPAYPVVEIGGRPAALAGRGPVSLTVISPAGTAGALVAVTVADREGRSVTMRGAFRYDGTAPGGGAASPGASPAPAGTAQPSPTVHAGPGGSVHRPLPRLGTPTRQRGLQLAPVLANNPLAAVPPARWPALRCGADPCRAAPVR